MIADAGGKVLAFKVINFVTPCAETVTYTVTLKTNYCGDEGTDVAIAGGFPASGWTNEIWEFNAEEFMYVYFS